MERERGRERGGGEIYLLREINAHVWRSRLRAMEKAVRSRVEKALSCSKY